MENLRSTGEKKNAHYHTESLLYSNIYSNIY